MGCAGKPGLISLLVYNKPFFARCISMGTNSDIAKLHEISLFI
jgi:hypothetical protein